MAAQLFMWLVAFVIIGFLWFWIVRPILEDWGVIGPYVPPRYDPETKQIVKDFAPTMHAAADDMSTPITPNSTAEPVRTPAEPAEPLPVRAQTHQIEPVEPAKNEPVREPAAIAITARLERAELITLLAVQKNADGGYTFSSNKITEFVGGTASEVKAQIAMIRNPTAPKPAAQNERGKTLRRPAEGW